MGVGFYFERSEAGIKGIDCFVNGLTILVYRMSLIEDAFTPSPRECRMDDTEREVYVSRRVELWMC